MTVVGGFGVGISRTPGAFVIAVDGEVDAYSAPRLREALTSVEGRGDVVIDAAQLTFIDSSGLGVLVGTAKRLSGSGYSVAIRNARPSIVRVLEMTGLAELLDVEASRGAGGGR